MKLAIATCLTIPEVDVDEEITVGAFRDRGHEAAMLPWDDPNSNPADYDAVIVRSTWNYPDRVDEFANWIKTASTKTKLLNPSEIMLGNLNKRYLSELALHGIPVVPTEWIWTEDADQLGKLLTTRSVIKPTIGAGSMDTRLFAPDQLDEAAEWLRSQGPSREFMVQPYLASVNTVGEQSIVMIGSEPSHRIRKHPRFADGEERVDGPFDVSQEFADLASRIIEPIQNQILYARVDLMMDNEGNWVLSELELIEPSLFFRQKPEALADFVERAESLLGL